MGNVKFGTMLAMFLFGAAAFGQKYRESYRENAAFIDGKVALARRRADRAEAKEIQNVAK